MHALKHHREEGEVDGNGWQWMKWMEMDKNMEEIDGIDEWKWIKKSPRSEKSQRSESTQRKRKWCLVTFRLWRCFRDTLLVLGSCEDSLDAGLSWMASLVSVQSEGAWQCAVQRGEWHWQCGRYWWSLLCFASDSPPPHPPSTHPAPIWYKKMRWNFGKNSSFHTETDLVLISISYIWQRQVQDNVSKCFMIWRECILLRMDWQEKTEISERAVRKSITRRVANDWWTSHGDLSSLRIAPILPLRGCPHIILVRSSQDRWIIPIVLIRSYNLISFFLYAGIRFSCPSSKWQLYV